MIDTQLMNYFRFDQNDLYANQKGIFTNKQRVRLIQEDKSERKSSLAWGIVLMVIGAIGLVIAIVAVAADNDLGFRLGFGCGFGIV